MTVGAGPRVTDEKGSMEGAGGQGVRWGWERAGNVLDSHDRF